MATESHSRNPQEGQDFTHKEEVPSQGRPSSRPIGGAAGDDSQGHQPETVTPITDDDILRVRSILRLYCPVHFDLDQMALDIIVESWSNGYPKPSWRFIKNRAIDALRSQQVEDNALGKLQQTEEHDARIDIDQNDLLNRLTKVLTRSEGEIIYLRFYENYSLREIAKRINRTERDISETLAIALYKMRQASEGDLDD